MQQWIAEIAFETRSGPKRETRTYYLPTIDDVRREIRAQGAYPLRIRTHKRSAFERMLARSSWQQVQLLRGIAFRSSSTSPSVAFWRLIEAETNPRMQNILSPAREALSQGLSVIDALKSLQMFDHSTIAILSASERSNRLHEGIPHAIQNITQKRKNVQKIAGTMAWLGFDLFSIVQGMWSGRGMILGWFRKNAPTDPVKKADFDHTLDNLANLWNVLLAVAIGATLFFGWLIASFWLNRGKRTFMAARIVRKIPLIGAYLRDLGFADSMAAAARMIRGNVPITSVLQQAAEATNVPEVTDFWMGAHTDLSRGISLGAALDRDPLNRGERMELMTVSDLNQIATVLESVSEMRAQAAKTKNSLILWLAFLLTGLYLLIAFGSAIFALRLMNFSMDNMMQDVMGGGGGGG
jgi:type II secretory pathway component PulF